MPVKPSQPGRLGPWPRPAREAEGEEAAAGRMHESGGQCVKDSWSKAERQTQHGGAPEWPSPATSAARLACSASTRPPRKSRRGACRKLVASASWTHGARPSCSGSVRPWAGTVATGSRYRASSAAGPNSSARPRSPDKSRQGACRNLVASESRTRGARSSCSGLGMPSAGTVATGSRYRATSTARPACCAWARSEVAAGRMQEPGGKRVQDS
jgi:hypothetical protein